MKMNDSPFLKRILLAAAVIVAIVFLAMGGMVFLHAGMMSVVHFLLGR